MRPLPLPYMSLRLQPQPASYSLCSWTPLFGSACNGAPTPQLNENRNASARRFDAKDKGLPFFVFFYIDDHIAVAKGRGGGWAYWARTDPKWDLEHGIV